MEDDHEPIGIVLALDKDEILVEYATGGISNQLYLPDVEVLKQELRRLLDEVG